MLSRRYFRLRQSDITTEVESLMSSLDAPDPGRQPIDG
jgi:hypothetical protein